MDSTTRSQPSEQSEKGSSADSMLSQAAITKIFQFALLLTGTPETAEEISLRICDQFSAQVGQVRNEQHRAAFLVSKIRELAGKSSTPGAKAGFAGQFSSLPEPSRSALALFYLSSFALNETAALLNTDLESLSQWLASGRKQLVGLLQPGSEYHGFEPTQLSQKGLQLLPLFHPERAEQGNARVAKAVKAAEADPELKAKFQWQVSFDRDCLSQIEQLSPSPSFTDKIVECSSRRKPVGLGGLKHPAFLSVAFALLVVIGVLFYVTYNHMNRFAGQEQVMDLLETTEAMSGVELEPKATKLGLLGDYLFSKYAFDDFKIPSEFSDYQTVGCRVFKQNGKRVAQVAVEPNNLIFFFFQPDDFGVTLRSRDGWRTFEQEGWAGAVRYYEGICIMMAMQGDKDDIEAVLAKIKPAKKTP